MSVDKEKKFLTLPAGKKISTFSLKNYYDTPLFDQEIS